MHFYDLQYEAVQKSQIHHREMQNTKITEDPPLLMHSFKQEIFTDPDNLLTQSPHFVLHSMTDPQYLAKTLITCTLQVSYNI